MGLPLTGVITQFPTLTSTLLADNAVIRSYLPTDEDFPNPERGHIVTLNPEATPSGLVDPVFLHDPDYRAYIEREAKIHQARTLTGDNPSRRVAA